MRRLFAVVPVLALACGEPSAVGPLDQRAIAPAAPAADLGMQVVGPEIVIPAGQEQMICWVPDLPADVVDRLIKRFETVQGASGHHLVAMKSMIPRAPGEVFDCTTANNMATIQPLLTSNTENKEGTLNLLTDDFAVRIPAGTQLVMQSHYVNVEVSDIVIRDVGTFTYLPADEQRIEASYMAINDSSLRIPANNERYSHSTDCIIDQPMQFAALLGHMHEWGQRIVVEKISPVGTSTIYEVAHWSAQFRDAPPVTHLPLAEPLTADEGDILRVTCEWQNDTGEELTFPKEMCDALFLYYPARPEGFLVCGS